MGEETNVEEVEIEIDEEAIVGYLVDEDDNEIGLIYKDENGKEVELYYDEIAEKDAGAAAAAEATDGSDDSEEMEIDPDSVLYYMVTPDGKEIGFAAMDEDGKKQEYLYPESVVERFYLLTELEAKLRKASSVKGAAGSLVNTGKNTVGGVVNRVAGKEVVKGVDSAPAKAGADEDDGVSKDDLKEMFTTFKDVAVDGYAALSGVLDQVDDVRDQLDDINPKKRREKHRVERAQQKAAEKQAEIQAQAMAKAGAAGAVAPAGAAAPAATSTLPPLNVKREVAVADAAAEPAAETVASPTETPAPVASETPSTTTAPTEAAE